MLFNSAEFIFLFLPLALLGFFQVARWRHRLAIGWLMIASLFFYSYLNPANLPLLLSSVGFNYAVGWLLIRAREPLHQRVLLAIGIGADLLLIGYFKYANFFISSLNQVGTDFPLEAIVLPLGISFFTFQQIACLVDLYRGQFTQSYTLLNYVCFITFFPYLISGPLLHFDQVVPQFTNRQIDRFNSENLAIGLTIFAIGLFKKAQIADSIAPYSNQVFAAATTGTTLTFFEAWLGALGFTLQLYFDFSGYSDMAIGIARLFGIRLPVNFSSPYKAESIIDFWRRWHITLSNFLRDYLYIPLGGNRQGEVRRNLNLMLTMLIGGLWHGAGWNFVIWGGLHGFYLIINHQWRSLQRRWGPVTHQGRWLGCSITFLAVVISWVFFRAESFAVAQNMLQGMAGIQGISLPETFAQPLGSLQNWGVQFEGFMPHIDIQVNAIEDTDTVDSTASLQKIGLLLLFVWLMPNTQQWLAQYEPTANPDPSPAFSPPFAIGNSRVWKLLQWRPTPFWAVVTALLTVAALLNLAQVQQFLYFEF